MPDHHQAAASRHARLLNPLPQSPLRVCESATRIWSHRDSDGKVRGQCSGWASFAPRPRALTCPGPRVARATGARGTRRRSGLTVIYALVTQVGRKPGWLQRVWEPRRSHRRTAQPRGRAPACARCPASRPGLSPSAGRSALPAPPGPPAKPSVNRKHVHSGPRLTRAPPGLRAASGGTWARGPQSSGAGGGGAARSSRGAGRGGSPSARAGIARAI